MFKSASLADLMRVLAVAVLHGAIAYGSLALTRESSGLAAVWPANAVVLAAMVARPRTRIVLLLTAMVTGAFGNYFSGTPALPSAVFGIANVMECAIIALLLDRYTTGLTTGIDDVRTLYVFCLGSALACAISATLAASVAAWLGSAFVMVWTSWFLSAVLGQLLIAPLLFVAVNHRATVRHATARQALHFFLVCLLVACVAMGLFGQSRFPLLFLINPAVAIATFRMRTAGAVAATLIVAVIGSFATTEGTGPLALVAGSMATKITILQSFLVTVFIGALPVASLLRQRDMAMAEVKGAADRFADLVATVGDVIFTCDRHGNWTFLSAAWENLTGQKIADAIGRPSVELIHPDDRAAFARALGPFIHGQVDELRHETRFMQGGSIERWVEVAVRNQRDAEGTIIGGAGILTDISDRRKLQTMAERARLQAERHANTDELTGVASRRAFLSALTWAIEQDASKGTPVALAIIDVDHFKTINDRWGHAAGDTVLRRLGAMMSGQLRASDTVGRIGGEEFAVLMPGSDISVATAIVDRLRRAVEHEQFPGLLGRRVTISAGIAVWKTGDSTSQLLADADRALYVAKSNGRNRYAIAA